MLWTALRPLLQPSRVHYVSGSPHLFVWFLSRLSEQSPAPIWYHLQVNGVKVHSLCLFCLSLHSFCQVGSHSVQRVQNFPFLYLSSFFFSSLSHCWVLHPTPSPLPPSPLSPKKMSVSLTTDIQQEGESGPLIEPCSRGKTSPQPQGTKEGTGESLEPDDSSPQDAQVGEVDHTGDSKFAFRC